MSLAAGTTLATYTIERLLGRGGMGEVYLATQAGLGRKVALKLLTPELAADPRFRERFITESRLAASLDHPHIVPIYEAGEADGQLFLAMRYVEGNDLGAVIANDGRLQPDRALGLLVGIAAALDAAHDRGLVHRDVKPGNILVARTTRGEEHAYLGDFGLTKQQGSDVGFTRTGQVVGSVNYVAPEQIEGRPIDHRADVYSLACVLYTALAGRPPYPRETEVATLWAHVQAEPPRLSDIDPTLAPYDRVIAQGMAKDPANRYQAAGELMRDAAEALGGRGAASFKAGTDEVMPRPTSGLPPIRRIGRSRLLAAAGASGIVALTAAVAIGLMVGTGPRGESPLPSSSSAVESNADNKEQPPLEVGDLAAGTYSASPFDPVFTLRLPPNWGAARVQPDAVNLYRDGGDGIIWIHIDRPVDIVFAGHCVSSPTKTIGPTLVNFIDWLQSNRDLRVTDVKPVVIGSVSGIAARATVIHVPGGSCDPFGETTALFPSSFDDALGLGPDDEAQFMALNVHGTRVVVTLAGTTANLELAADETRLVLESIRFR